MSVDGLVHDFLGMMTIIGSVGSAVVVVCLGEDEDVVTTAERILEDGSWAEIYIGVMARSLVCRGTVKVPDSKLANVRNLLADGLTHI